MVRAHLPFLDIRSFNKEMYLIFSLNMYCHFSTFIVRPLCDTLSFRSQVCACIFSIMATTKARVKIIPKQFFPRLDSSFEYLMRSSLLR